MVNKHGCKGTKKKRETNKNSSVKIITKKNSPKLDEFTILTSFISP